MRAHLERQPRMGAPVKTASRQSGRLLRRDHRMGPRLQVRLLMLSGSFDSGPLAGATCVSLLKLLKRTLGSQSTAGLQDAVLADSYSRPPYCAGRIQNIPKLTPSDSVEVTFFAPFRFCCDMMSIILLALSHLTFLALFRVCCTSVPVPGRRLRRRAVEG